MKSLIVHYILYPEHICKQWITIYLQIMINVRNKIYTLICKVKNYRFCSGEWFMPQETFNSVST